MNSKGPNNSAIDVLGGAGSSSRMGCVRDLLIAVLTLWLGALSCSTGLSTERDTGVSPSLPDWTRLKSAAMHAAADPITVSAVAASAAIYLGGLDRDVSDWAREDNPLFGSPGRARDYSDALRDAAIYCCYAGMGAETVAGYSRRGLRGLLVPGLTNAGIAAAAIGANSGLTSWIKSGTGRLRPDGSNRRSFPSGHASEAAVHATLASHSAQRLHLSGTWSTGLAAGMGLTVAATAWARIEGGRHYPSDVLAGAALGRFLADFVSALFLASDCPVAMTVQPGANPSYRICVRLSFAPAVCHARR